MGKKRVIKKGDTAPSGAREPAALKKRLGRSVRTGMVYINSTYNNTIITITDDAGGVITWASAGSLGFSGARKGTPYAAAKVAETLSERVQGIGFEEARVFVRGVGAGRESAIRSLSTHGILISAIKDLTPIPFNGPRPAKVRRV